MSVDKSVPELALAEVIGLSIKGQEALQALIKQRDGAIRDKQTIVEQSLVFKRQRDEARRHLDALLNEPRCVAGAELGPGISRIYTKSEAVDAARKYLRKLDAVLPLRPVRS